MDRLLTMRVFQAVADEGGFSAAARRLELSVSTVTRLVADLEQYLGVRLLQRTTRHVALTDAGEVYLQRVRVILDEVEEAFGMAQAQTGNLSGAVRILVSPVFAEHLLAPLLLAFRARQPKIVLDVFVDALREAREAEAMARDYDILLMGARQGYDANVVARPLVTTDGVLCASAAYLAAHGVPQQPQDLAQHHCLMRRTSDGRSGVARLYLPQEPLVDPVDVAVVSAFTVNHTGTLLRATLEGAGISALPLSLVAEHLADGRLQRVLAPWVTGRFTLYAVLPSRKFMPARVRAFLDFLSEYTQGAQG